MMLLSITKLFCHQLLWWSQWHAIFLNLFTSNIRINNGSYRVLTDHISSSSPPTPPTTTKRTYGSIQVTSGRSVVGVQKNNNKNNKSPWSPSEWTITLDIGRVPGVKYDLDENWGASGARLILPIEVLVESEYYDQKNDIYNNNNNNNVEHDDFLGEKGLRLSILEDPMYITMKGQQTVPFKDVGAWKISTTPVPGIGNSIAESKCTQSLRFWLDTGSLKPSSSAKHTVEKVSTKDSSFQSTTKGTIGKDAVMTDNHETNMFVAAQQKDVTLLSNQRLYFFTNCWRINKEYYVALQQYQQIEQTWNQYNNDIYERLSHETGDRRLDGMNPIDTIAASIDMAVLIQKRDDTYKLLRTAQQILPTTSIQQNGISGLWPGTTIPLMIAPGIVAIRKLSSSSSSSRIRNAPLLPSFGTDEYQTIGTFTAKPSHKWEIVDND